jgi:tetratricopeptide (TPR) repeat protein
MSITNLNTLHQQGLVCHQQGNLLRARELYLSVLEKQPRHFDALHMLGILEAQTGHPQKAQQLFEKAIQIDAKNPALFNNLGNVLKEQGLVNEALSNYDKAINLKTNYEQAYNNRGNVLFQLNDHKQAIANFNRAIRINPNYSEPYNNIGNVLFGQGKFEEAVDFYSKALKLNNQFVDAYQNRGNSYKAMGKWKEAIHDYEKTIQLNPSLAQPYSNLASVFYELKELPQVIHLCNKALSFDPRLMQAYYNRGLAEKDLGQLEEAIQSFHKAIELRPDYREARLNKGLTLLKISQFKEGWDLFDSRIKAEPLYLINQFGNKQYIKELDLIGQKNILIINEQGVGDQVLYAGLLRELFEIAPQAMVMSDKRLLPLYERSFKDKKFVSPDTAFEEIDYDECMLIGDLCRHFRKNTSEFQRTHASYLFADERKAKKIRNDLKSKDGRLICGIAWRSKNIKIGTDKSLSLEELLPLLSNKEIQFVNIQYGDVSHELKEFKAANDIEIIEYPNIDNYNDLDGHAALIEACDLVVAVSNTSMHIAGAIGKEAYLLCSNGPGALWYWSHQNNGHSLWYPSISIHQQSVEGNWKPAISSINTVLKNKTHVK